MRNGIFLSTFMALCLAACGGGGGGTTTSPAAATPTPAAPTPAIAYVFTGDASNVGQSLASLNGYFVNTAGRSTEVWFEWGSTAAYGQYTVSSIFTTAGGISKSTEISGLAVGTTYHYMFCAKNVDGKVCGSDRTFTPVAVPIVTGISNLSTGAASNVTETLASLNGYFVNPEGRTTEAWFEWGSAATYGNYSASFFYGYAGGISQAQNISGLAVGTSYHFRFCAKNADGSNVCGVDRVFIPSPMQVKAVVAAGPADPMTNAKSFVVDASDVYWLLGGSTGSIWKRPLTGGTPSPVASLSLGASLTEPFGLAVDANNAYWTEQSGGVAATGTLKSASLAGVTVAYRVLATGLNNPQFVVVAAGYVYFSEFGTWDNTAGLRVADGTISRVPVFGGAVELLASQLNGPQSIKVDATRVYWTEVANYTSGAGSIKSVPLAGGSVQTLVSGLTGSQNIAIDSANVYYWSSYGTLSSVPVGGATASNPVVQMASGVNGTPPLASDATSLYWTESANGGALTRLTKASGAVKVLTSELVRPDWIAVDTSNVYWMQDDSWNGSAWNGLGAIFKTAK